LYLYNKFNIVSNNARLMVIINYKFSLMTDV
jgi:hypothetical protein